MALEYLIREGKKEDLPAVLDLIRALAVYERAGQEVAITVADLERDGFGDRPIFHLFVAEVSGQVQGMALYYYKYSTWKGRCLYLEDLVVHEVLRGQGLGGALFEAVVARSRTEGVSRMEWQVLDWNEPAIRFYKRYNALLDPEWLNGRFHREQLVNSTFELPKAEGK